MSDYPSMATLQNNSPSARFAAALERVRLVAAKLEGGGGKRPLEDGNEPSSKKVATSSDTGFQQPPMGNPVAAAQAAAAAAGARLSGPGSGSGALPPAGGPPNLMPDQAINEYIRVPDNMVGLIIGRGGEQITRLQAESGCKIQMAPDSGQPERMCTLTGSREAIQRAKDLVNQIVNHRGRENAPQPPESASAPPPSSMPPMRGGGGGGGLATEEIMLPGPKVGLIIGKNGKTIKQLQEQSGAKMVVIQDGPNTEYEKPLRISGDPAKVEHAKQLVFELLADKDLGQPGPRPPYDEYGQDQGNGLATNSTEVLVPRQAVGVVIGRGGDMIKRIQAETGARVQFHQERDDGPGDKRCYLQGKPHQVDQARQMIEDLITSVNRRETELRSGGRPRGGGGGGSGSGGGNGSGNGGGGSGFNARNGERGDFQPWQDNSQEIRVTFTVSNFKCGHIIGKGGEVIKQINAQSGAHCELDRRAQGSDRTNRTFYIRGSPDAVEHCKRIIVEKVGMPVNFIPEGGSGPGMGNGNGNGNGNSSAGAEYYAGGGGGPPAWGYNPHWHQPANMPQPQQQVQINPATGQPDYSQQWIDYYRSLGFMKQAEAVEMQAKQQQQGGGGGGNGGAGGGAGAGGGGEGGADYSAQWAEYYRSIGKVKEAEAIEAQIKIKQQQQQQQPQQPPQPPQQQQQQQQQQPPQQAGSVGGGSPFPYVYGGGMYAPYAPYPGYHPEQHEHQQWYSLECHTAVCPNSNSMELKETLKCEIPTHRKDMRQGGKFTL